MESAEALTLRALEGWGGGPGYATQDGRCVADFTEVFRVAGWNSRAKQLADDLWNYGETPLAQTIGDQARDRRVHGRPIMIRRFSWPAAPNCHVLLISSAEKRSMASVLQTVAYAPVLTISEFEDFTSEGCVVRFNVADANPRFQVNMAAASNAQLRASSLLLNVAGVTWAERGREETHESGKRPVVRKRLQMKNGE